MENTEKRATTATLFVVFTVIHPYLGAIEASVVIAGPSLTLNVTTIADEDSVGACTNP
jgi:hypothetical protein